MEINNNRPRRLGCDEAIMNRGYKNYSEVAKDLEKQLVRDGYEDQTVNSKAVAHYIATYCNFSSKRVAAIATLLGVVDTREIDDVWDPPTVRGMGRFWVNRRTGDKVKDYDLHPETVKKERREM